MTDLLTPFGAAPDAVDASPRTPVLVTEQQVLFATVAAVPLQPGRTSRGWTGAVRAIEATLRTAFVTSSNVAGPKRRHYPARHDFLENSRMAREMDRL